MSTAREFVDKEAMRTAPVFELTPDVSTASIIVRRAASEDLKTCGLSRDEVAVRLSAATGQHVSAAMIDAYVGATKPHRFPAELLPAWVEVTGSRRLLAAICAEAGLAIATEEDQKFAELGRARLKEEKLSRELWGRI